MFHIFGKLHLIHSSIIIHINQQMSMLKQVEVTQTEKSFQLDPSNKFRFQLIMMKLLIILCSFFYSYGPDTQAATKRCWKLSHDSVTFTLLIHALSPDRRHYYPSNKSMQRPLAVWRGTRAQEHSLGHHPTPQPASQCIPESTRNSPLLEQLQSNQAALPPLSSALLYLFHSLSHSLRRGILNCTKDTFSVTKCQRSTL